jgi:hypothetical protein
MKILHVKAFYFLNYVIHDWYKKRDEDPVIYSILATTMLLFFNLSSVVYWVSICFSLQQPLTKHYAIYSYGVLVALSYVLLYHRSRYRQIFADLDLKKRYILRYYQYVRLYIIITIVSFLSALVAADIRVDGHL